MAFLTVDAEIAKHLRAGKVKADTQPAAGTCQCLLLHLQSLLHFQQPERQGTNGKPAEDSVCLVPSALVTSLDSLRGSEHSYQKGPS